MCHAQAASAPCDARHGDEIRATRIGGHAHRYLLAARPDADRAAGRPLAGHVVSTFRHGLNIVFDEEMACAWVSVQTPAVPFHPWAVEVPAIPGGVVVGTPIQTVDSTLILGLRSPHAPVPPTADHGPQTTDMLLAIHMPHATCHELRIAPYSPEEAERALSHLPLLERLLEEEAARRPADPFQPQIDAILERWRATGDPTVLAYLVGLGIGSTPSGDDLIVGLAAGLAAFARCPTERDAGWGRSVVGSRVRVAREPLQPLGKRSWPLWKPHSPNLSACSSAIWERMSRMGSRYACR